MQPIYLHHFERIPARFSIVQANAARNLVELRLALQERAAAAGRARATHERGALERRLARFGAGGAAIDLRGTEIEDYVLDLPAERDRLSLFGGDEPPDLGRRMEFYRGCVEDKLARFYPDGAALPDHLIHVTCTGYVAPSAAQVVAARSRRTDVTHAYHMGCYAALPAIRIGRGFACATVGAAVDIVHTEVCSLHFDPRAVDAEQLVVQSLFADGHIKYSLGRAPRAPALEVCALREAVLPGSRDRMTWTVGPQQFDMTLARDVPAVIAPHLRAFVDGLLDAGASSGAPPIFAVHPGGPRIIDGVERALALDPAQTRESRAILRRHGNMSSATLPHIWQEILADPARADGDRVVSLAFGPGLTLGGGVFRVCRP